VAEDIEVTEGDGGADHLIEQDDPGPEDERHADDMDGDVGMIGVVFCPVLVRQAR
jgi:hypothetical protein